MPLDLARRIAARLRGEPERPGGHRGIGHDWEREAERALAARSYRIIERNFRTREGEIDLIARDGEVLCFVEVKGRASRAFGSPAEAVTLEKQRRIARAAAAYLARLRGEPPVCRFDVVCIDAGSVDPAARVTILQDAFEGPLPPRRR
jgi:putative endonuclease